MCVLSIRVLSGYSVVLWIECVDSFKDMGRLTMDDTKIMNKVNHSYVCNVPRVVDPGHKILRSMRNSCLARAVFTSFDSKRSRYSPFLCKPQTRQSVHVSYYIQFCKSRKKR